MSDYQSALIDCLRQILKPIARFCLRQSIGLQDILESLKVVLIEVAAEEMQDREKKVNISRLSAITGVHRKDAVRIYREGEVKENTARFTSRVIGQWRRDRRFLTKSSRPRTLTFKGDDSEFAQLVSLVGKDLHPGTVLFDLERIGAVERTSAGLKLTAKAYVPRNNPIEGFRLLAADTEDLIEAVTANVVSHEDELPNYHGNLIYDNIDESDIPKVRSWFFKQCSAFHQRAAKQLARYDQDLNPDPKKKGGKRVVFTMFTRT